MHTNRSFQKNQFHVCVRVTVRTSHTEIFAIGLHQISWIHSQASCKWHEKAWNWMIINRCIIQDSKAHVSVQSGTNHVSVHHCYSKIRMGFHIIFDSHEQVEAACDESGYPSMHPVSTASPLETRCTSYTKRDWMHYIHNHVVAVEELLLLLYNNEMLQFFCKYGKYIGLWLLWEM